MRTLVTSHDTARCIETGKTSRGQGMPGRAGSGFNQAHSAQSDTSNIQDLVCVVAITADFAAVIGDAQMFLSPWV